MTDQDHNDATPPEILLYTPIQRLFGDFALSAFGLAFGLVMLSAWPSHIVPWIILGTVLLGSGWFTWRTLQLMQTKITLAPGGNPDAIAFQGKHLPRDEIASVDLRFFGGPRAAKQGTGEYQLRLTTNAGQTLFCDSRLEGFEKLVTWLAETMRRRGLGCSVRTRAAFAQFAEVVAVEVEGPDTDDPAR